MNQESKKSSNLEIQNIYPVYLTVEAEIKRIAQLQEELAAILKPDHEQN